MEEQNNDLAKMRHSLAHIMATAIKDKWPDVKFGVGPITDNGFYYDIDLGGLTLKEGDLPVIEQAMKRIINDDQVFTRFEKTIDEAIEWAKDNNQPYKQELLNDLKREGTTLAKDLSPSEMGTVVDNQASKVDKVSFYQNGDFVDLCRGPHVQSTGQVGAFKIVKVAGAYWRGNSSNNQMQRVYGVAFSSDKDLSAYLLQQQEALARDHRKIAKEMDLVVFSDLVGSGLPLFTPRGTIIRDKITEFSEALRRASGFEKVDIPHITKTDLYKVSGHWDKFGDELFLVKSQETSDQFALKPMNCPHHNQIYASLPRSYKDLPIKYFETTKVYRDEKSGELGGLSRVRSITQDDSHVYASVDQIDSVVANIIDDIKTLYETLGMEDLNARLSYKNDEDKYLGQDSLWQTAQSTIKKQAEASNLKYFEAQGEAAFYGPKIDFMATDAIGRQHQVATVQLDFVMPERFDLAYTAQDGSQQRPVMIHCAMLGSIERFLSIYIEHTAGRFPVWLAPEQFRILTINQEEKVLDFTKSILVKAKDLGLRATIDDDNQSISKKIRNAEIAKIPYVIVIGNKEIDTQEVTPRIRKDMSVVDVPITIGIEQFLKTVVNEANSRVLKTSL
jgi:threonyl-tRNA synthetase